MPRRARRARLDATATLISLSRPGEGRGTWGVVRGCWERPGEQPFRVKGLQPRSSRCAALAAQQAKGGKGRRAGSQAPARPLPTTHLTPRQHAAACHPPDSGSSSRIRLGLLTSSMPTGCMEKEGRGRGRVGQCDRVPAPASSTLCGACCAAARSRPARHALASPSAPPPCPLTRHAPPLPAAQPARAVGAVPDADVGTAAQLQHFQQLLHPPQLALPRQGQREAQQGGQRERLARRVERGEHILCRAGREAGRRPAAGNGVGGELASVSGWAGCTAVWAPLCRQSAIGRQAGRQAGGPAGRQAAHADGRRRLC